MIFFSYGLILFLGEGSKSEEIVFETEGSRSATESIEKKIVVDVEGAVIKPGVYSLPKDSRVKDALVKAGGLSLQADRDWVGKSLNLAIKLQDGYKIYIPRIGETGIMGKTSIMGTTENELINLNSATAKELDSLPGVGLVTAQKIIDGRRYSSIDELLSKKIVGASVFEKIKEKVTVY